MTGASGAPLSAAAVDLLLSTGRSVIATATPAARMVWAEEMDESFGAALERWKYTGRFDYYGSADLRAPIASGTFPTAGMAIVPASMATIAAVATGLADNLPREGQRMSVSRNDARWCSCPGNPRSAPFTWRT